MGIVLAIDSTGQQSGLQTRLCSHQQCLVSCVDEKLKSYLEDESAIRASGELARQAGKIFRKLHGYETEDFIGSNASSLLFFGLSPTVKALLPPPIPDGGYPGGDTAKGFENALHDVNTAVGINNTAVGANALTHDTTGNYNMAIGEAALASNIQGDFNWPLGRRRSPTTTPASTWPLVSECST